MPDSRKSGHPMHCHMASDALPYGIGGADQKPFMVGLERRKWLQFTPSPTFLTDQSE